MSCIFSSRRLVTSWSRSWTIRSAATVAATAPALGYVVPTLEALLGREDALGLDVTTVTAELTMDPHAPVLASLITTHEASMADAHDQARRLAATIGTRVPPDLPLQVIPMTDLLVLGGSGRAGTHVLTQAAQRGHRVRRPGAQPRCRPGPGRS